MGLRNNKIIRGLHFYSFGLLKRLYDWVLSWAETRNGAYALFLNAVAESSFFPIPPDVLQIALSVGKPKKSFLYALIASIGSVLGGIFGYYIGYFLFESVGKLIINALGYQEQFLLVGRWYASNAFLAILGAAFTPIPYKVFTIAAGFWQIGLWVLLLASVIGRPLRFFIVATLIYFFGARVKVFIDKYFNWLSLLFFVLLVLGFIVIKYLV
jgi:membrane protein YqaA with SNARE-associated domain